MNEFWKRAEDIAATLERKRQEIKKRQEDAQTGTLAGLENVIRQRKQQNREAQNAEPDSR
jgi:hypothetical protein